MVRHLLLGTAGHVDHGKTSLIAALTGVDTDRLPEEKRRGLTVDLGFASLKLEDVLLGIIDVPGHERFVRNMLAGATGIDLALLVVAADEGVMPQTIEHFEVLKHLRISSGVVALTKCDVAGEEMIALVRDDIAELVAGTFLEAAPLVEVSSKTLTGLDELRGQIARVANELPPREGLGHFRMPIDRSFTLPGHGTVVTGSVAGGEVTCGDKLQVLPQGDQVTVRELECHGEPVQRVARGQRAAVNLVGIHYSELARGDILATPGSLTASKCLSVQFEATDHLRHSLKERNKVRFYSGTTETVGQLRLPSESPSLAEGKWVGQLDLEDPVHTVWREAFVLRGLASNHVIGGGIVIDSCAPRVNLRDRKKNELLAKTSVGTVSQRVAAVVALSGTRSWTTATLAQRTGAKDYDAVLAELETQGEIQSFNVNGDELWLHRETIGQLDRRLLQMVEKEHQVAPARMSIPFGRIRASFSAIDPPELLDQLAMRLHVIGQLRFNESQVSLPDWQPALSETQEKHLAKIVTDCVQGVLAPPSAVELANQLEIPLEELELLQEIAVGQGELIRLPDKESRDAKAARRAKLHLHFTAKDHLLEQLETKLERFPRWTLSQFCEAFGISRKYAIPLCVYLDENGFTQREGDFRTLNQLELTNYKPHDKPAFRTKVE